MNGRLDETRNWLGTHQHRWESGAGSQKGDTAQTTASINLEIYRWVAR